MKKHSLVGLDGTLMTNEQLSGVELIAQERQRQVEKEGWTQQHDDQWKSFELSMAAIAYLLPSNSDHVRKFWPWDWKFWKPKSHIQNLIRAGALIAAEIDRLQRKAK